MKRVKITDTERFKLSPFKNRDAVTISVYDQFGHPRMLTVLWGVEGTNAVEDYCEAFVNARRSMQVAANIEQQYNSKSARVKEEASAE